MVHGMEQLNPLTVKELNMSKTKKSADNPLSELPEQHDGSVEGASSTDLASAATQVVTPEEPSAAAREAHEYADLFPMYDEEALEELAADIKKHGLRDPIILYDGKILDGRNRAKACEMAGIEPECVEYDGDDLLEFVLSKNAHRRHLTESQRAMVASKLATLPAHRPAENKSANLPTYSQDAGSQDVTSQSGGLSQAQAAKMLNVSERLVRDAVKVRKEAAPEVIEQIERGAMTVNAAHAKLSKTSKQDNGKSSAKKSDKADEEDVDATPPVKNTSSKGSTTSSSLNDRVLADLKIALELPANSTEQSDALVNVVKKIISDILTRSKARNNFQLGLLEIIEEDDA